MCGKRENTLQPWSEGAFVCVREITSMFISWIGQEGLDLKPTCASCGLLQNFAGEN